MFLPDLGFRILSITDPDPGSRGQKNTGVRIRNTAQCLGLKWEVEAHPAGFRQQNKGLEKLWCTSQSQRYIIILLSSSELCEPATRITDPGLEVQLITDRPGSGSILVYTSLCPLKKIFCLIQLGSKSINFKIFAFNQKVKI
jgi:hypothetical protein